MPKYLIAAFAGFLLAGCGSNTEPQSAPQAAGPTVLAATAAEETSRAETVAQLYLAYFMRPADPYGEENFSRQLAALGIPNDIDRLNEAYFSNTAARQLVDTFANSAEALRLHGTPGSSDDITFVNNIYLNLFGRPADLEGLRFWSEAVRGGQLTRAGAALMIASAARTNQSPQGLRDGALVRNRLRFSTLATTELKRLELVVHYTGDNSAAIGRRWLATVSADDTPETIARKVGDFIKEIKGELVFCDPGPCNVTG